MRSVALFVTLFFAVPVTAQSRAQNARVINADTPVFLAGRRGAPRRGTLARNMVFETRGRIRGDGCSSGVWIRLAMPRGVGVVAAGADSSTLRESIVYVCSADVEITRDAPQQSRFPELEAGQILPHNYAFVRVDGARTFVHPQDYLSDDYYSALGAGFGVVISGSTRFEGMTFTRTRRGLFILQQDLRSVTGSDFAGVHFSQPRQNTQDDNERADTFLVAWAKRDQVRVSERAGGRTLRRAGGRTVFHVSDLRRHWVETREGEFIRRSDLHIAERVDRPEELAAEASWVDIDVSSQVLVAYSGDEPIFATLISSGRAGRNHATPHGLFRIWVKLAFSDMDNLESEWASQNYAIERVPWVQYFEGGNGLHAAFWHDGFGTRRSHGCINLSPRDARTLFEFTEPALPEGFTAIFPQPEERTSYVQVRP